MLNKLLNTCHQNVPLKALQMRQLECLSLECSIERIVVTNMLQYKLQKQENQDMLTVLHEPNRL